VAGTYSSSVVLMQELGFSANTMACLDSDMHLYRLMSIDVGSMVWDRWFSGGSGIVDRGGSRPSGRMSFRIFRHSEDFLA
jgi:hypothetical protein